MSAKGNIAASALFVGVATGIFVTGLSSDAFSQIEPESLPVSQAIGALLEVKAIPIEHSYKKHDLKQWAEQKLGSEQFSCINVLWNHESEWDFKATNPSSGAYGIPQSLPDNKMSSAGKDWKTNPYTQMKWGINYIEDRYETPCNALNHWNNHGWY
jgi:hypothetical protein